MFKSIAERHPRDTDFPDRTWRLMVLKAILDGTFYDVQPHAWHIENSAKGYVPVSDRAPSVRYNLCRMATEDSVALLFGDGHFPGVQCEDENTIEALKALVAEQRLDLIMTDAATRGSVGSIAIQLRVLKQRIFIEAYDTFYLTPKWHDDAPDTLQSVTELYKVKGSDLAASGYSIEDDALGADHWFMKSWDAVEETWFVPAACSTCKPSDMLRDATRSVRHNLGFCPWVWIKNLPGGKGADGACTFGPAIDNQIEIEFQLSLAGRGLKYSVTPTLLVAGASQSKQELTAGDAIYVDVGGDAKWLEINGSAPQAAVEYCGRLREMALEVIHGNRSNADKLSAAQSGKALELLHQPLIWLADKLRLTYGESGLLPLLRMIVAASAKMPVLIAGKEYRLSVDQPITLSWPRWFPPTAGDRSQDAGTLNTLTSGGLMSQETAVKQLAPVYDVPDVDVEIAAIKADEAAADARTAAQAAAVAETEVSPSSA